MHHSPQISLSKGMYWVSYEILTYPSTCLQTHRETFSVLFLVWLLQVKCQEVAIDGISDLKESVDVRIRGVKRSLEDDLTFVQDGDNFLNKRMRTTDRLQNSFEGFQHKVHDIWQELFCLATYAFEVKPTLAKWTNFHSIPKITS